MGTSSSISGTHWEDIFEKQNSLKTRKDVPQLTKAPYKSFGLEAQNMSPLLWK